MTDTTAATSPAVPFEDLPNDRQEHDVLALLTRPGCRLEGLRFAEIWQAIAEKRPESSIRALDQTLRRLKRRRAIALQRPRWVAL